ncbi:hypothetical protein PQE72_gp186 [Bacillus phage vB_BanS_Skywalker]|uniref:Uncharacterized protein n=2 Tax=Tsamsavirus TaxID=3044849 RepID=A0AAE9CET3_9CAUD|nr:hypothetical protein PQE72_gp186 [Bacillus phage vB_BanS_Skywalker]YP_010681064.1 hypothetical protein PQE73_gp168 [Bacillus phage vB_BanS_MrDarsey]UGO48000.1 hypothetical protein MRDARSEY_168 [Bacillus phage vB_BanS_MrDarsey]UGO51257.1 hypothetical protein SKYWALKER_100 [Bacillus phage vB_BanS_Skywalker]
MFSIIGALLGGFILQLFGFDNVVQTGMLEVFGKTISDTSYYFLFGMMGASKSVFARLGSAIGSSQKLQKQADDLTNKLKKK